jgi:Ca2+-binding RTX toxin-like protein
MANRSTSSVSLEVLENRTLFATTPPPPTITPPPGPPAPPPLPKPGIVLNKGVLAIGGDPKVNNTITVSLSKDGKSVNVTVNGKAHSPFAASSVTDVVVAGGPKDDTIKVALGGAKLKPAVAILGLDGNDKITAGAEADLIFAGNGNDVVNAGAGNDIIIAGPGKDVVHAGDGDDILWGDKDDLLDGGTGKNVIHNTPPPPQPKPTTPNS